MTRELTPAERRLAEGVCDLKHPPSDRQFIRTGGCPTCRADVVRLVDGPVSVPPEAEPTVHCPVCHQAMPWNETKKHTCELPTRHTPDKGTVQVCPTCQGDGTFVALDGNCPAKWAHRYLNAASQGEAERGGPRREAVQSALMDAIEAGVKGVSTQMESGLPMEAVMIDYAKIVRGLTKKLYARSAGEGTPSVTADTARLDWLDGDEALVDARLSDVVTIFDATTISVRAAIDAARGPRTGGGE